MDILINVGDHIAQHKQVYINALLIGCAVGSLIVLFSLYKELQAITKQVHSVRRDIVELSNKAYYAKTDIDALREQAKELTERVPAANSSRPAIIGANASRRGHTE